MEENILVEVEGYELSDNQKNLWLAVNKSCQGIYNQVLIEVDTNINTDRLPKAIGLVIDKHEILSYKLRENKSYTYPIQLLSEQHEIDFSEIKIQNDNEQEIHKYLNKELDYSYDVKVNNPIRFCLINANENKKYLGFRLYSIWGDTYSNLFFCNELTKALVNPIEYEKNELEKVDYINFCAWQNELINDPEEEADHFWRTYNHQINESTLPFVNKSEVKFNPKRKQIDLIKSDRYINLKDSCNKNEIEFSNYFLFQFGNYLSSFSEEEISLGYIPFKRNYEELENTIGLVNKTLPVKFAKDINRPKIKSIKQLNKQIDLVKEWSDYFSLDLENTNTTFKNCFEFIDLSDISNKASSSTVFKIKDLYSVQEVFDLKLNCVDYGDRISLELYYNENSFEEKELNLIIEQLKYFYRGNDNLIENRELKLSDFEKTLITESNTTKNLFKKNQSIIELFEIQVKRAPENIALIYGDKKITYKELNIKSNQFANYLLNSESFEKGKPVCVLLERSESFIVSILGILKAGGYYIPIDTTYPIERIQFIIKESESKLLITDSDLMNDIDFDCTEFLSPTNGEIYKTEATHNIIKFDSEDIAYCIYTSGSTGNPKGCLISHGNLSNYIQWSNSFYFNDNTQGDWGLITSVSFDLTVTSLFSSLTRGKMLWIGNEEKEINELLKEAINNENINTLKLTPAHLSLIKELRVNDLNVDTLIVGGDQLSKNQVEFLWEINENIRIFNEYGPTEATVGSIVKEIFREDEKILIGKPIANTTVRILDENQEECPVGVKGEIIIYGLGLSFGYLNRPNLTKEKFIKDTDLKGVRGYKTGDIGRWLPDGNVEYIGRKDDQVKIRGYRIELGEIENILLSKKSIEQVITIVSEGESEEKELITFLVATKKQNVFDLRNFLSDKLPSYMIPSQFIQMDKLPLTINGKIDKKYLSSLEFQGISSGIQYVAPRNDLEEKVVVLWEEILEREKIGVKDDFFALGGHSLKATRLINGYHKLFDVKISLKDIFSHTTLESHVNLIEISELTNHYEISKVDESESYPLSAGQLRLWALSQIEEGSAVYNIPNSIELIDDCDLDCFERAVEATIDRHEILRTVFKIDGKGELRQFIKSKKELDFKIKYLDFRDYKDQENQVKLYITNDSHKPFDLVNGPLLRASIFHLSDEKYVFYYNMHHIISDGWSMDVLSKDILSFYESLKQENAPLLTPLRIQYKDYASWQLSQMKSASSSESKQYWLEKLSGELPVLNLPSKKIRPAIKTQNGYHYRTYLSKNLTGLIKEYSQERGGSLFISLLSVWNILFYKYTSDQDIIVGSPVAGRDHSDLLDQIGFYVNTLAFRNQINPEDSFNGFYDKVKESTLSGYNHQMYPFDSLVEDLDLKRDLSRSAIFDALLLLQNTGSDITGINISPDQVAEIVDFGETASKCDIELNFQEIGDYISFDVIYNSDIYEGEMIKGLIEHYKELFNNLLTAPEVPISSLRFLTPEEESKILLDFNNTTIEYPKDKTIIDLFKNQVEKTPENTALVYKDSKISYKELDENSNCLANYLIDNYKIGLGDVVGVKLKRSDELIITLLAILKAGAAYIPMDPLFPKERLDHIIKDSGVSFIIKNENNIEENNSELLTLEIEKLLSESKLLNTSLSVKINPTNTAYIIYTSGSTGIPKGVEVGHQSLLNFLLSMKLKPGMTSKDILFSVTTYSFDISILEFFTPLLSGATLYIPSQEILLEPTLTIEKLKEVQPTIIQATPSFYQNLFNANWKGSKNLKVLCGGDVFNESLSEKLYSSCLEVWNMYGPTETTIWSSIKQLKSSKDASSIGKPINNTELYVLDKYLNPTPIGVSGAIYIGGEGLAKGYYKNELLTKEKFIKNPFETNSLIYETGDLGKWNLKGEIEFLGRNDNQVKINGYRIELGDIEYQLLTKESIKGSAVIAKNNIAGDKELVAYIVSEEKESSIDLRKLLSEKVPHYMIPKHFQQLDALPLTNNGKIDRKSLLTLNDLSDSNKIEYVASRNEIEEKIVKIIADELDKGDETIGVLDNFFDLGVTSIKLIKILNVINEEFETALKPVSLFQFPNVSDLATYMSGQTTESNQEILIEEDFDEVVDLWED